MPDVSNSMHSRVQHDVRITDPHTRSIECVKGDEGGLCGGIRISDCGLTARKCGELVGRSRRRILCSLAGDRGSLVEPA
jgi:hypothetical protein